MKLLTGETKQHQLEWRRSQVVELSSMGHSQREIARILQVDLAAVNRDLHFLRQQAQQNIQKHIRETMPEEYQKANVRMDQVLKRAWYIPNTTADERVRLQALALIDQCNSHNLDMVTNGAIVSDALKYVNGKAEKLKNSVSNDVLVEEEEDDYQTRVTTATEKSSSDSKKMGEIKVFLNRHSHRIRRRR